MKTRFCPSPTGLMTLGNARTALFSYLYAHANGGNFLLRIEDTDRERSKKEYDQAIQADLRWLGLQWDEGPAHEVDEHGPYHQSERQAIYDDYYQRLQEATLAYPCFCSDEQLALTRRIQRSAGKPPRYSGVCRSLSQKDIQTKLAAGVQPTLRFRVPDNVEIRFTDLVRGEQIFQTNDIGDFIIRRADGKTSFMFCNAIDDALMSVTHALRGEDHLTNTPRQIMILQALGFEVPQYGHLSLIVGMDGSPLSKRHGSRSIQELRHEGFLPLAICNYMGRLGHYYANDKFMSMDELAEGFKIETLSKSPAKFNPQQLLYWQKEALQKLSEAEFWSWAGDDLRATIPIEKQALFAEMVKPNVTFPTDIRTWSDICFSSNSLIIDDADREILSQTDNRYFQEASQAYKKYNNDYQKIMEHIKNTLNLKGKALFQPLRVALTGKAHGPELAKLLLLLEPSVVLQRLQEHV